jgi:hypothetical protein
VAKFSFFHNFWAFGRRARLYDSSKKRPALLLEIIIGLGLSACLFTVLFRFLVSYATIEKKVEIAQIVLLERERIQQKLGELFTSIETNTKEKSFYTLQFPNEKSTSLIILYNAGVDPDPAFSGLNTGRLYLNTKGEFCLTQWTLAQEDYRTEVLLKNITALDWELFGQKPKKNMKATLVGDSWAWLPTWPKEQSGVPGIIRLKLWCGIEKKKKGEPNLQFAFILPTQEPIQIFK